MITRNNLEGGIASTAVYSDCEHYRYSLRRVWEPKKQKIIFESLEFKDVSFNYENSSKKILNL